jgi:small-conductance mechanosensitive channel
MTALASRQAEKVRLAGITALQASHVAEIVRRIATGVAWALVLLVGYLCLTFALEQFPYTRAWGERLGAELVALFVHIGQAILGAIPGLFVVVVIFLLARFVVNAVTAFLHRFEAGHLTMGWLDADTAGPTRRIASVIVWLFALAMAYPYLPGSQSDAFKGLSVLVGLMVSIGASGVIGQALSGLSLMYSKALRQGEYVKIGETEGTVTAVGMFATKIRTGMGEEVSLPNAVIVGNPVRNFSRVVPGSGFVLHTTVTIGYSTPWRQVHAMLMEAANRTPGILKEPTPFVVQTALSDWYVEYRLCAVAGPEAPKRRAEAMNALHANIQDVFNEYGVQIMSPHYVMDTAEPQVVPKENWAPPPAARDLGKAGTPRSE